MGIKEYVRKVLSEGIFNKQTLVDIYNELSSKQKPMLIFVNQRHLSISDPEALTDNDIGYGSDSDGEEYEFRYKDVEFIEGVGGRL